MSTVSYKFHAEKVAALENKMLLQRVGIFFLIVGSIYLGYQVYDARHSEAAIQEKIQDFKSNNSEDLAIWRRERAALLQEKKTKGRLSQKDRENMVYLGEEIAEMECHHQTINLLEIRLTYP
jgi:hypothetical protein